jgi:Cu-processing system permease protein
MVRIFGALIAHEALERARDRWVLISSALFALLAGGISLYGRSAGDAAGVVAGPSMVTLATFLVPLVALVLGHDAIVGERERNTLGLLFTLPISRSGVLVAKYLGRALALVVAISCGMGVASLGLAGGQRSVLIGLIPDTLLLGAAFLSIGVLLSVVCRRLATAATLVVGTWFLMVLFYDLGLLALMVATDGAVSQDWVAGLISANPAGLYRTGLMVKLLGQTSLEDLGLTATLPGPAARAAIWAAWIAGPLTLGGLLLHRPRAATR